MCNLYTLAPWEVRNLIQYYRLIGSDFEEVMRVRNETLDVYPNRPAPVVVEQDGQRVVRQVPPRITKQTPHLKRSAS